MGGIGVALAASLVAGALSLEQQVMGMVLVGLLMATAVVCFYDPTISYVLWLWAFPLINRYTHLNLPAVPDMSGPRFMVLVMIGVVAVQWASGRLRLLRLNGVDWAMLLFLAASLADMVLHRRLVHGVQISPITQVINGYVIPFLLYFFVRNAATNDRAVRRIFGGIVVLALYFALTAIFERFRVAPLVFPPDILDPEAGGGRWFGVRVRGPFLNSPIFGTAISMTFYVALHVVTHMRGRIQWVAGLSLLVAPLATLYTLTRQVWLGFVAPLAIGVGRSRFQRRVLVVLLVVAIAFALFVDWSVLVDPDALRARAQNANTGSARLVQYAIGWHMFLDHPITGIGLEQWMNRVDEYKHVVGNYRLGVFDVTAKHGEGAKIHNALLRIVLELGLLGAIPYCAIWIILFRKSLRLYRALPRSGLFGKDLVLMFWQVALAYIILMTFTNPMHSFLGGLFFGLAAVISRRAELVDESGERPVPGYTLTSPNPTLVHTTAAGSIRTAT